MTPIVVVRMSVTENVQTVHHLHRHSLVVSCATVWSHCQSHAGRVVTIPP